MVEEFTYPKASVLFAILVLEVTLAIGEGKMRGRWSA